MGRDSVADRDWAMGWDSAACPDSASAWDSAPGWDSAAPELAERWNEHERRWPAEDPDLPRKEETTWQSGGYRRLDTAENDAVERGCERIHETEETIVSPALRRIEADDTERQLIGFEYRLKGADRIKEKVVSAIEEQPDLSPEEATALVKDAVRYTFQYTEELYAAGTQADTARLRDSGFEPVDRKNSWSDDEYKGINSRWRVPETGLLFEVQFHTRVSFEAKQLTHAAYERLRRPTTSDDEAQELREFQRDTCRNVPVPPGATDIPDMHWRR